MRGLGYTFACFAMAHTFAQSDFYPDTLYTLSHGFSDVSLREARHFIDEETEIKRD